MVWFFDRAGERLQCEIRRLDTGPGFEMVWEAWDGRVHVERSDDASVLVERRRLLETWLKLDGWVRRGRVTPVRPPTSTAPARPITRVIVRRNELATFALLKRIFADDPHVQIIWDRRVGERRQLSESRPDDHRQSERRREPPTEWQRFHYLTTSGAADAR